MPGGYWYGRVGRDGLVQPKPWTGRDRTLVDCRTGVRTDHFEPCSVLTPPPGGAWAAGRPREVLPGEAVSGGEALVGHGYRGVRFLLFAWPVFAVAGVGNLLPGPASWVLPFPFGGATHP